MKKAKRTITADLNGRTWTIAVQGSGEVERRKWFHLGELDLLLGTNREGEIIQVDIGMPPRRPKNKSA